MPIGIVSDEDFEKELENTNRTVPTRKPAVVVDINKGRGEGNKEVPEELRKLVGITANREQDRLVDIASAFSISTSSVSAYKNGATSTASYNQPDKSLQSANLTIKDRIADKAHRRVLSALKRVTGEKLDNANLKTISQVAKDLSIVAKNMESQATINNNITGPNYVFFAPRVRKEQEYEIIATDEKDW